MVLDEHVPVSRMNFECFYTAGKLVLKKKKKHKVTVSKIKETVTY